jgi:hypothetical protein
MRPCGPPAGCAPAAAAPAPPRPPLSALSLCATPTHAARGRFGGVGQGEELGIGLSTCEGLPACVHFADRRCENDRTFELARIGGEIGLGFCVQVNDRCGQGSLSTGRPRFGEADQGDALRLDHLRGEALEGPTSAERAPRLKMCIRSAPGGELIACPFIGPFQVG